MPRRPRLRLADLPLHVIQRGNNRAACFFAEDDYRFYLHHLGELAAKTGCAVHAYVLMTNHVHLLLTPKRPDAASRLMQRLGQRYVQYVNKTYKRSGTLWEGRFKASLVQVTDYFLKCQRYIEMNPVRADMVGHPLDYPWSSYLANAEGSPSALIVPHAEYLALGAGKEDRQAVYRGLFSAEFDPEDLTAIRRAANGGYALGDARFREEVEAMLNKRAGPGVGGRPVAAPRRDERQTEMF